MNPLTYVVVNVSIIALIWIGGVRVNQGALTQGQVVALYNYMSQILVELIKLANLIINITKALACAGRIQSIFDVKPGMQDGTAGVKESDDEVPVVEFKNAALTYSGAGDTSIAGVSFKAYRGQTIGIIGGTGSGKSSLVGLIPRFYDATEGEVLIDGVNVKDIKLEELRDKVGIVMQKAVLFKGSIRNNMQVAKQDATDGEIDEALAIAQAKEFVDKKDGRLDYMIEQGGKNLSGGQRQRIGIARTLALRPEFIVCDEPISALDVSIQAQVINLLEKLQRERGFSYLFIAHDLEMVYHISHKIGVMYLGNMVELGSSDDVYKKPLHPYTRALISAAPIADPHLAKEKKRIILKGEVPSPLNPPVGCPFAGRCRYASESCRQKKPEIYEYDNRKVACNLYSPENLAKYKAVGKTPEQILAE